MTDEELEKIDFSKPFTPPVSRPATYKWLAILMCFMATVAIALGLILSFKTMKRKWLVAVILLAGCLLPFLMLKLGQGRL